MEQLMQIKGIGKIKAIQILCLSELAKRLSKADAYQGLDFRTPSSIAEYYMEDMRHRTQEHMKLLMLNTKAKLLGETTISKGTVNASLLTPRELFIEALQKNAVSIILLQRGCRGRHGPRARPRRHPRPGWRGPHVRPRPDRRHHRSRVHPRDGQGPHRPLR